jgi:hypothetical protein
MHATEAESEGLATFGGGIGSIRDAQSVLPFSRFRDCICPFPFCLSLLSGFPS